MASNKYKGRPKVKASRIKAEQIDKITETFFVDGLEISKGDDPESCPPETNWDFLVRRGTATVKKGE
tara:strand:- start:1045 stop:1245 length:201 start_codon:yes stop_codon:yes gene_type:complete